LFSGSVYGDDYKKALNEWKLSAEQGDVIVQYNLGLRYANGEEVPKDSEATRK
jgi:TPR repeat protein